MKPIKKGKRAPGGGRKPLPKGEKKILIQISHYVHPKTVEAAGGEVALREKIRQRGAVYLKSVENKVGHSQ